MSILLSSKIPNPTQVIKNVKKDGFLVCNNAISMKAFKKIQRYWLKRVKSISLNESKNYDRSPKYTLGQENFVAFENKKKDCRLKIQEFLWNDMQLETKKLIIEMHKFTNMCQGHDQNRGLEYDESKKALSLSVNYYPSKIGCLDIHRDVKSRKLYLWMIFNLTFKNEHFDEGGLYLINKNKKKINLDEISSPGSVIFFNGMLEHGVDKIKSKKGVGKISVFPFYTEFMSNKSLPATLKIHLKLNDKISSLFNPNYRSRGLQ